MKSRFLTLIGAGLAIALAGCSAEELAALNAEMQKAGAAGAQTGTAVTAVGSTTTTINSTVQTIQTVTDMASSVSDMSSSSESLSSSSSTASSGSATNSGSLMGGVRGVARRQTTTTTPLCDPTKTVCPPPPTGMCDPTKMQCPPPPTGTTTGTTAPVQPPPPPKPPNPETACTSTPPAGSFIPCFCVFHKPAVFADKGDVTCEEHRPPSPGEGSAFQKTTGIISVVTQDDGCLKATFSISGIPSDAQVGDQMKQNCTVSGTTMSCKQDILVCPVTAKCQDGTEKTFYNPAGQQQERGGPPTIKGRFEFPAGLKPPDDFTKDNKDATIAWLKALVAKFEAAKEDKDLRALLKTFVKAEPGWTTQVNVEGCNLSEGKPCPPDMDPNAPKMVKAKRIQFGSNQQPPAICPGEQPPSTPPLLVNYHAGFFVTSVDGKVPGLGQVKMDVFGAELEKPSDTPCTPEKLDGSPVSDSMKNKGRLVSGRRAEVGTGGEFFSTSKTERCMALEAATVVSRSVDQSTPPITYVSEKRNDVRQLPKPQPNKAGKLPDRYPVFAKEDTKMFMVVKPQGLRGKAGDYNQGPPPVPQGPGPGGPGQPGPGPIVGPPPVPMGACDPAKMTCPIPGTPPPAPKAASAPVLQATRPGTGTSGPGVKDGQQGQGPSGTGAPGQMMQGCPGEGAGTTTVTMTFAPDGKEETRTNSFIKKEGQCRPTPVGKDGKQLDLTEDDKGNLTTTLTDEKTGEEIKATIENPDSENKVVKINAGLVTGSISYHAADEKGIIAEGELKVKVLKTEVEVTILLSEAGWQHVRGKVSTTDGKDVKWVVFWQDRTTFNGADGAEITFALGNQDPGKVPETPATTGADATGTINMGIPGTTDKGDCENTGNGVMQLLTGTEVGQELTLVLYEDETSIVKLKDGTIANEPLEGCALAKGGTGKATSASTTGQTASGGQATTTGGTATATAYTY